MFVPGHNERLLASVFEIKCRCFTVRDRNSVQPVINKQIARDKIKEWVIQDKFNKHLVFPRVNDRESGQLLHDVYQLTIPGVHGFMYPKSKRGEDVYFIDKLLETIEYEKGFPIGHFKLIPLIETSAAVLNAQDICSASKRVIAIAFGCEDFISDLEGIHDAEHMSLFTPRAIIAMAARATGVVPIDTVHINVHDLEDLELNCRIAKKLGYEGMLVLNPKELELAHQYFSPSEEEVHDAEEMLTLFEESQKEGKGVAVKNNKFIGPPMVSQAKKVLEKHRMIVKKNENNG